MIPDIGSRLELFVDHSLIESLSNARLQLHHPQPAEVALRFDAPWEGFLTGFLTVLREGNAWHLYYRGKRDARPSGVGEVTCYARSDDGIRWHKPELGLFEFGGSKRNNIIRSGDELCHNFTPFLDTNPRAPDEFRFKATAGIHPNGVFALGSRDGVLWQHLQDEPVFKPENYSLDSQNVAFWSESEECYAMYFRSWRPDDSGEWRVRWVSRTTSPDFRQWSEPVEMETGDVPPEQLYINQTQPYFRAPHLYVATAARFMAGRRILSDAVADTLHLPADQRAACSDAVLLTSRGGHHYDRTFMESLVRPGPGPQNWSARCNYPALGIHPTGAAEISLYIQREFAQPTNHLRRTTLRTDGFSSVSAGYSGGEMRTRPFVFGGRELTLNMATSAAGEMRVEVQDAEGKPLPGFALGDCASLIGDEIARRVQWTGGSDVSTLAGRPVRLRFVLKDADLYALQFRA